MAAQIPSWGRLQGKIVDLPPAYRASEAVGFAPSILRADCLVIVIAVACLNPLRPRLVELHLVGIHILEEPPLSVVVFPQYVAHDLVLDVDCRTLGQIYIVNTVWHGGGTSPILFRLAAVGPGFESPGIGRFRPEGLCGLHRVAGLVQVLDIDVDGTEELNLFGRNVGSEELVFDFLLQQTW
jgi:hypothetical protein